MIIRKNKKIKNNIIKSYNFNNNKLMKIKN